MLTEVDEDDTGCRYYAALYCPGCLAALPCAEPFGLRCLLQDPAQSSPRVRN